jgi:dTDP-4-dehydrorhamnose reductase
VSEARRWLVTGAGGQLGQRLQARLAAAGEVFVAVTRAELDIADVAAVGALVDTHRPAVVINAAAYTKVDDAEAHETDADRVNHVGARVLAEAVAGTGGRLVHVSTDYVFAGDAERPYEVDDPIGPRSAYGRTKLAGEQAVLEALPDRGHIVRSAWVYGGPGPNFVDTMLRLEKERDTVDVVTDQIGSPTSAADLAAALVELGSSAVPAGVLHFVNAGQASWCELARETFRLAGADPSRVRPTDTASFPRPAPRPAWSVLSTTAWTSAGLTAPRAWQAALADVIAER